MSKTETMLIGSRQHIDQKTISICMAVNIAGKPLCCVSYIVLLNILDHIAID